MLPLHVCSVVIVFPCTKHPLFHSLICSECFGIWGDSCWCSVRTCFKQHEQIRGREVGPAKVGRVDLLTLPLGLQYCEEKQRGVQVSCTSRCLRGAACASHCD